MKYNWHIHGHEQSLEALETDLETGNLPQAYLFVGPSQIGKFSIAKKLAGILQCKKNFCHECATCVQVANGNHLDTLEMANDGESIKIDQVRKMIERLQMTGQSKYKIVLIDGLERMTNDAANSFLKTLEEPSENTIFLMTTDAISHILPTVVSRVRIVKFRCETSEIVATEIKKRHGERTDKDIDYASLFSFGKMGRAIELMENPEKMDDLIAVYNEVEKLLENPMLAERFAYAGEMALEDAKVKNFLEILTVVTRKRLLADGADRRHYAKNLLKIADAGMLLKKNVNTKLILENLMLAL